MVFMDLRRRTGAASLALALLCLAAAPAAHAQGPTAEELRREAIGLAYSHRHEEAMSLLRKAAAIAPDSSEVHRTLASVTSDRLSSTAAACSA